MTKTISQKNLDKMVKEKGWQFTPDSKKAVNLSKIVSTLTQSTGAITDLARTAEGIERVLLADRNSGDKNNGDKEYLSIISRFTESLENLQITLLNNSKLKYVVKRDSKGFISEIMVERK